MGTSAVELALVHVEEHGLELVLVHVVAPESHFAELGAAKGLATLVLVNSSLMQ